MVRLEELILSQKRRKPTAISTRDHVCERKHML